MPKGVYTRTEKCNMAHCKHGMRRTKLYSIWNEMKMRCNSPNDQNYYKYGARGITLYKEWETASNFISWALNNGYKQGLTIDRVNNNEGYSPSNCHWVTAKEQANNRRTNINITIGEETKTLKQWCEHFKLVYGTVWNRYKKGCRGEKLFKPSRKLTARILENEINAERQGL